MKLYYVVNARMPSDKAYAIQIGHMQKAFSAHAKVRLLTPSNFGVPDWYASGKIGFFASSLLFMVITAGYLLFKRLGGERFVVYMPDMDTFSGTLLPYIAPTFAEMHSPKKPSLFMRVFFSRVRGVVATTIQTKESLIKSFGIPAQKFLVEPNGVDESFFNLSGEGGGAVYVGRLYAWKGLEVLPAAAQLSTVTFHIVGGTREEFEGIFGRAEGLRFDSVRPEEVPRRIAEADVLLLVGTSKNDDSNRYTSPMKVFEYLASGKPVVASATEALKSIIPERLVKYCPPDDAAALARAVEEALHDPGDREARIVFAREHTWERRAGRILAFMDAAGSLSS